MPYDASVTDSSRLVILERDEEPISMLTRIEEYEQYRAPLAEQQRTRSRGA